MEEEIIEYIDSELRKELCGAKTIEEVEARVNRVLNEFAPKPIINVDVKSSSQRKLDEFTITVSYE